MELSKMRDILCRGDIEKIQRESSSCSGSTRYDGTYPIEYYRCKIASLRQYSMRGRNFIPVFHLNNRSAGIAWQGAVPVGVRSESCTIVREVL